MKKLIYFFSFLLLAVFASSSWAQLPPYYNFNTNGSNNSFPFNIQTGKKVQYLYLPAEFNTPSPAPSGNITNWWFRSSDIYPLNATYTNIYIRMGRANLTALPTGAWYTGPMDTVFFRASGFSIHAAVSTWYNFILDRSFAYRND